uniref:Uncharacterized protein n=1 Tax=Glossina austeni TaxID=7395 RepID=A0A1A9VSX0_GLOAU
MSRNAKNWGEDLTLPCKTRILQWNRWMETASIISQSVRSATFKIFLKNWKLVSDILVIFSIPFSIVLVQRLIAVKSKFSYLKLMLKISYFDANIKGVSLGSLSVVAYVALHSRSPQFQLKAFHLQFATAGHCKSIMQAKVVVKRIPYVTEPSPPNRTNLLRSVTSCRKLFELVNKSNNQT